MYIIVSIDTECDCSPTWHLSSPVTFKGVTIGIKDILQPLFDDLGVKPVYFLSHEVMEDDESREVLRHIANRCELASHLHSAFIEPQKRQGSMEGVMRHEMQRQYSYEVEYGKMKNLTDLFVRCFGQPPASFRAGRYGIGPNTGKILTELGYKVDSSVTPHIRWKDPYVKDAPGFIGLPEDPYWVCDSGDIWKRGKGPLLEVPICIRLAPRILTRFWRKQVCWFRPWVTSTESMKKMLDAELEKEQTLGKEQVMVMMFHNMEVIPAASPYPQTETDVLAYVTALKETLTYAKKIGARNTTLDAFYQGMKK